jgi:hypothetical protein
MYALRTYFSNPTRFYVMSGRISSNPTRYDVKAGTIRKNEYKWRYLKSPKLNWQDMENNYRVYKKKRNLGIS